MSATLKSMMEPRGFLSVEIDKLTLNDYENAKDLE
jgi:hypothetical protein